MKQSRLESLVEVWINVGIGFVVSFVAYPLVAAWHGLPQDVSTNLQITAFYTVLSVLRGYAIRRWFNSALHQIAKTVVAQLASKKRKRKPCDQ